MSRPETDLLNPRERNLIKIPVKLLKVEATADGITTRKDLHNNREGFSEIRIHTENGIYSIKSCCECHAVFWEKVHTSGEKAKTDE